MPPKILTRKNANGRNCPIHPGNDRIGVMHLFENKWPTKLQQPSESKQNSWTRGIWCTGADPQVRFVRNNSTVAFCLPSDTGVQQLHIWSLWSYRKGCWEGSWAGSCQNGTQPKRCNTEAIWRHGEQQFCFWHDVWIMGYLHRNNNNKTSVTRQSQTVQRLFNLWWEYKLDIVVHVMFVKLGCGVSCVPARLESSSHCVSLGLLHFHTRCVCVSQYLCQMLALTQDLVITNPSVQHQCPEVLKPQMYGTNNRIYQQPVANKLCFNIWCTSTPVSLCIGT